MLVTHPAALKCVEVNVVIFGKNFPGVMEQVTISHATLKRKKHTHFKDKKNMIFHYCMYNIYRILHELS